MQFLLGIFYYIEAAVLFEDFYEAGFFKKDDKYFEPHYPHLGEVHYYDSTKVTEAYHNAA